MSTKTLWRFDRKETIALLVGATIGGEFLLWNIPWGAGSSDPVGAIVCMGMLIVSGVLLERCRALGRIGRCLLLAISAAFPLVLISAIHGITSHGLAGLSEIELVLLFFTVTLGALGAAFFVAIGYAAFWILSGICRALYQWIVLPRVRARGRTYGAATRP